MGPVEAVGSDFVALRTAGGRTAVVALGAVAAVAAAGPGDGRRVGALGGRTAQGPGGPGGGESSGGRSVTVGLAEVLAHAAGNCPRVQLHAGAVSVVGELRAVGTDVISVHTDGDPPATTYVSLTSVSAVSFLDSG
jgi:hypothetical protein